MNVSRAAGNIVRLFRFSYIALTSHSPLGGGKMTRLYFGYYLRSRFRSLFGLSAPKTARIGRVTINTPDFFQFIYLFEEIFLRDDYGLDLKKTAPYIIDAGANIGMATCYYKMCYPQAKIEAFEADPATCLVLKRTIEENGWTDCQVIPCAVSENEGELSFYTHEDRASCVSNSAILGRYNSPNMIEHKVTAVRLSSYIKGPIDLLKIDVEGSEAGVFRDLEREGKLQLIEQMLIEYHHHAPEGSDELGQFLNLLQTNGFGYNLIDNGEKLKVRGVFQDINIYAYRKSALTA